MSQRTAAVAISLDRVEESFQFELYKPTTRESFELYKHDVPSNLSVQVKVGSGAVPTQIMLLQLNYYCCWLGRVEDTLQGREFVQLNFTFILSVRLPDDYCKRKNERASE